MQDLWENKQKDLPDNVILSYACNLYAFEPIREQRT